MEINYFLDSQQIMFENLIADVGLEGEIFKSCETTIETTKTYQNDVGSEHNEAAGQQDIQQK
jgi:hypothetical protein